MVEFINNRMYIILRGRWCVVVLNVQSPTEDKNVMIHGIAFMRN
jgi:hypothetical protein